MLLCTAEVVSAGSTVAFVEASIVAAAPSSALDRHGGDRLVARATYTYIFRSREPDY